MSPATIVTTIFRLVKDNPGIDANGIAKKLGNGSRVGNICSHLTQLFKRGAIVRKREPKGKFIYADAAVSWPEGYREFERPPRDSILAPPPEVSAPPPPPEPEPVNGAVLSVPDVEPSHRPVAAMNGASRPLGAPEMPAPVLRPESAPPDAVLAALYQGCADLGRSMADAIIRSMAERVNSGVGSIAKTFESQARATPGPFKEVFQHLNIPPPSAPTTAPTPTPAKRSVLIIGVSGAQESKVKREFDRCFDLKFWRTDHLGALHSGAAACSQLRDMMKGADIVYEMSRSTNAKVSDLAKSVGVKPKWCTGGLDMLKDQLTNQYALQ